MWSSYFSLFPQVIESALQVFMSLLQRGVIRLRMLLQPLPTKVRTSVSEINNAPSSNTCLHCKEQTKCSTYNKINNRQEWRIKMRPEKATRMDLNLFKFIQLLQSIGNSFLVFLIPFLLSFFLKCGRVDPC